MKEQIKKIIENYCQGIEWLEFNVADLDKMADEILALQLQRTGVMRRYSHPFVGAGNLLKETEKSLVIKLDFDGREYFAPKYEFTELK